MTKTQIKYIFVLFMFMGFTAFLASSAFAQNMATSGGAVTTTTQTGYPSTNPNTGGFFNANDITQLFKLATASAARQQDQLQNVIKGADMMIANRLTTLNSLNSRIQGDTRLSSSEKTSLSGDVQNAITGLTSLKAKIDADTNVATARADAKSIVANYYVYVNLEPKIRLLVALNNIATIASNLQGLMPQLQSLVTIFQTQGKDVSGLQSLFNDTNTQLSTIQSTVASDLTTVEGITTGSNNQATFTKVRQDLTQIIQTNFGKIRTDFAQMRQDFRQLIGSTGTPNATTSASPYASPSASPK